MTERSRISQLSGALQAETHITSILSAALPEEIVMFKNSFDAPVKIISVDVTFDTDLTGRATNHVSLQIRNKGTAGSGTKAVTLAKPFDDTIDADAFVPNAQVLGVDADLTVLPGEVLALNKGEVGTGQPVPSGVVTIGFQFV